MLCVNDFFARAVCGVWRDGGARPRRRQKVQSAESRETLAAERDQSAEREPVARAAARLVPARRGSRQHCRWRRLHTTAHGTAGRAVERDPLERAARYDATQ